MNDFRALSIDLGSWAGSRVRLHILLVVFVIFGLIESVLGETPRFLPTIAWMTMFLVVLVLHELGHTLAARRENADPEDVMLWPLGNLVGPSNARTHESARVAAGGLMLNGTVAIVTALGLAFAGVRMILSPIGGPVDSGAPIYVATGTIATPLTPIWYIGWFGWLNWVLFLANLIPALPFDMGRILRATLTRRALGLGRNTQFVHIAARTSAVVLAVVGVIGLFVSKGGGGGLSLLLLAILIEIFVRIELRMMEDGSFFEVGLFGYDFSEGYTGLDAQAARVRPATEGAIKRWRRKRAETRRLKESAEAAAEERRLDELLEKVHRVGKAGLTDEENRFLVRVSAKFRNRQKNHA